MPNNAESQIDPKTFFNKTYFEGTENRPSNYLGGYTAMEYGGGQFYNWELNLIGKLFPKGGTVIEVGAATGTFGRAIKNRWPDKRYSYFATDISTYALPQARSCANGLVLQNIEEKSFPFASNSADIVAAYDVFEHSDPKRATLEENINELGRLLKPEGLMLITLPLQGTWFKNLLNSFGIHEEDKSHVQVPTQEMVKQLISHLEENYALLQQTYFFPLPKRKIPGIPSNVLLALRKK